MKNVITTLIIANALSLNMIPEKAPDTYLIKRITADDVKRMINDADAVESVIGHSDTAHVVGDILDIQLEANRVSFQLDMKKHVMLSNPNPLEVEKLVIAQYTGPRLPEGCTTLPEGGNITFWYVDFFTEYEMM